jgi:hypothetical protein
VPRPRAPAEATKALVTELRASGVTCSARRLEDWARVGLVPRGRRRSLGRGRGTEVVYPPEMAQKCRLVAQRMRRGQPWQVVALSLFAGGVELPDETVRVAYRWAFTVQTSAEDDELAVAERGAEQFLHTAAGQRLGAVIAAHIKRSGVAAGESPQAVARSVLTNIFLVSVGGEPASDDAVIEVLTGMGLPVLDLEPEQRIEVTRFVEAAVRSFCFEELGKIADQAPMDELRGALAAAGGVFDVLPTELSALMPTSVAEVMPALLAPVLIQARRIAEQLTGEQALTAKPESSELSQRPATMDAMPLPSRPQTTVRQARSA